MSKVKVNLGGKENVQELIDFLAAENKAQADRIAELESPWIPVSERLPEFDQTVFCYCRIYGRFTGYYKRIEDTDFGVWYGHGESGILPPTHWMPLPETPKP